MQKGEQRMLSTLANCISVPTHAVERFRERGAPDEADDKDVETLLRYGAARALRYNDVAPGPDRNKKNQHALRITLRNKKMVYAIIEEVVDDAAYDYRVLTVYTEEQYNMVRGDKDLAFATLGDTLKEKLVLPQVVREVTVEQTTEPTIDVSVDLNTTYNKETLVLYIENTDGTKKQKIVARDELEWACLNLIHEGVPTENIRAYAIKEVREVKEVALNISFKVSFKAKVDTPKRKNVDTVAYAKSKDTLLDILREKGDWTTTLDIRRALEKRNHTLKSPISHIFRSLLLAKNTCGVEKRGFRSTAEYRIKPDDTTEDAT